MKHIAKLRKRIRYWQKIGLQAVQEIIQRIEKAYKLFFKQYNKGTRPPGFKKRRKYKSFTLKQAVRFVPMKPTFLGGYRASN